MTKRKIPPKDMVISIMKEVLKRRRVISTLRELWSLVISNLRKINKKFVITPQRIKRLALQTSGIEVKVKTRKGGKSKINSCPLCGSDLISIYSKNLLGKKIHTGYKCKKCSFKTGMKTSVPKKYIFVRRLP